MVDRPFKSTQKPFIPTSIHIRTHFISIKPNSLQCIQTKIIIYISVSCNEKYNDLGLLEVYLGYALKLEIEKNLYSNFLH